MPTPEQIKTIDKQIAVLEAAKKEGAIVEARHRCRALKSAWTPVTPSWDFEELHYRIRIPGTPTRRPLSYADFVGRSSIWIRVHSETEYPVAINKEGFEIRDHSYTWKSLPLDWKYSFDRITWNPCYVETPSGEETIISTE